MTIKCIIHRNTAKEGGEGTLKAYVEQGGRRGDNLFGRSRFTDIDGAIQAADRIILGIYRHQEPPKIEYVIEDYKAEKKPA